MKLTLLLEKFSRALIWNGLFYTIYKLLFVTLSFTLYSKLSSADFSLWATTNSLIFITLLVLDCGLKKSIPRYCPAFAKNKKAHKLFIIGVIVFQVLIIGALGFPSLFFLIKKTSFFPFLFSVRYYVLALLATEGMVAILRLVYHAHFWQKQFNLIHTFIVLLETVFNFSFIFSTLRYTTLVPCLFLTKVFSGIAIIAISLFLLPKLYKKKSDYSKSPLVNLQETVKNFIVHSAVMWASTFIKALSERNVLLPYFTLTLGPASANLFKVIHDGALFFQRMALKTIGVSDTALLGHLEEETPSKNTLQKAFYVLVQKVSLLCFPLLSLSLAFLVFKPSLIQNNASIGIFGVVTFGYLLEVLLSPYERILEAKRNYKLLWLSYTPYLAVLFGCFFFKLVTALPLLYFIMLLHLARLVSAFLMVLCAQKQYKVSFPFKFVAKIAAGSLASLLFFCGIFYGFF